MPKTNSNKLAQIKESCGAHFKSPLKAQILYYSIKLTNNRCNHTQKLVVIKIIFRLPTKSFTPLYKNRKEMKFFGWQHLSSKNLNAIF